MPDVSVIIPTWNRAELLEKAVRSALCQSVPPLEVLVCDDGSTDGSKEKIRAIGDVRIRWIEGLRAGCPAIPRNRGIQNSKGNWLAFLDDDDEWLPDKLEKQLALASKLDCTAVCSNAHRFIPGKGIEGTQLVWSSHRVAFEDLLYTNQVICSSVLFKKSLLSTVIGFPEDVHLKAWEDYALWLRIATLTDFAFVPEPLLFYRDDAANSIRNENVNVWAQRQTVFSDLVSWGHHRISMAYLRSIRKQRLIDLYHSNRERLMGYAAQIRKVLLP